jgi:hypothetical protein
VISLCAMAAFALSMSGGVALAHRAYEGWTAVWSNGPKCAKEKVTLDHFVDNAGHDHTGGVFYTEGHAQKEVNIGGFIDNCSQDWIFSPGDTRIRVKALKWSSSTGKWALCVDSGFFKNVSDTDRMLEILYAGRSAPCGNGDYITHGNYAVYWNGAWRGGDLEISFNERHHLRCDEAATC